MLRTVRFASLALAASALVAAAAPSQLSEIIVTVDEDEQPLAAVLKRLEEQHGLNYVVSQEVLKQAGTVTVHLKQVPLDVALEAICAGCGLRLEVRGPVLVIVPRGQDEPVLPRVDARIPEPLVENRRSDPAQPSARDDEADLAQAVGTLALVDGPNRRIQLQVEGVKRDFYLPSRDDTSLPGDLVSRLEQSLSTLKPGTRIALLYRRHPTHPVVTDLVGGAYASSQGAAERRRRPRRKAPAADVAPVGTPAESKAVELLEQLKKEEAERLIREGAGPGEADADEGEKAAPGSVKVVPANPTGPATAPEGVGSVTDEGILGGQFVSLQGEEVRLTRSSDGKEVMCLLPLDETANQERRKRIAGVLSALQPGDKLFLVFQEIDGKRYIKDTISQSSR